MPKPTFFIVGASKCGTSTLYADCDQHPDVGMCEQKEPEFFNRPERFAQGTEWYESLYAHCEGKAAIGEASPQYARPWFHPEVPQRLFEYRPDARLIFMVRHPLTRLQSVWIELQVTHEIPPTPINEWARGNTLFTQTCGYFQHQIQAFRPLFRDEQIKVIYLEDLKADRIGVLKGVYEFIGVDPSFKLPDRETRNISRGKPVDTKLTHSLRQIPGVRAAFGLLPDSAKQSWRRLIAKTPLQRGAQQQEWNAESKRFIRDALAEDMRLLHDYTGKPEDFWSFD